MKTLFVLSLFAILTACGNNNKAEVPASIKVDIPNSTQTIRVIHTVELSQQMISYIDQSCVVTVDQMQPPLPEPERTQAIQACTVTSVNNMVQQLMALIGNQPPTTTTL